DDFLATDQIGGDAAIGDGEVIERLQVGISQQLAVDQQADLMTGVQAGRQREPFLKTELNERWIVAEVFLAAIRKVLIRRLSADDGIPVLSCDNLFEFAWALTGSVEAPDQSAHAGAGDVVDRYVVIFKPLKNSDVCQAKCSAALERNPDRWPRTLRRGSEGAGRLLCLRLSQVRISRGECRQQEAAAVKERDHRGLLRVLDTLAGANHSTDNANLDKSTPEIIASSYTSKEDESKVDFVWRHDSREPHEEERRPGHVASC